MSQNVTYRGTFVITTIYGVNDVVFYNGNSYVSNTDLNVGLEPDTNAAWTALTPQSSSVAASAIQMLDSGTGQLVRIMLVNGALQYGSGV